MKFTFKNLGPIRDAALELGDLTLIAGLNNTGKSYIAYAIYGFLQEFAKHREKEINHRFNDAFFFSKTAMLATDIIDRLLVDKRVDVPMTKNDLDADRVGLVKQFASAFSRLKLDDLFNDNTGLFENSVADVHVDPNPTPYSSVSFTFEPSGELSIRHVDDTLQFTLIRSTIIDNDDDPEQDYRHILERWLTYMYCQFLLQDDFLSDFEVRCFTSVRPTISLFYKELESSRRLAVRRLQQNKKTTIGDDGNVWVEASAVSNTSRYVLPINDEIDFVKSIPDDDHSPKKNSRHNELHRIEKMVRGHYEKHKDEFYFVPSDKKDERSRIPLHLASSSVAELSNLYFFFRNPNGHHNQILIIDEPESHLDTANQIQLARLLARLVNSGVKVLITTHSDYIVKEINNLIMLSESLEEKEEVVESLGYSEDENLSPDSVKAYVAENGSLTPCVPDRFGVDMPVFDKTITDINRVANDLFARLQAKYEED